MDFPPGSIQSRGQQPPKIGRAGLAEERVEEGEELERPNEEGAAAWRVMGAVHGDEQPSVRLVHLDDFPGPRTSLTVAGTTSWQSGEVVNRVDVPREFTRLDGAERDCPLPGPVELDRVTHFEHEEGAAFIGREPLDLPAPEPLPSDRTAVLPPNRLGGSIEESLRAGGEVQVDREPCKDGAEPAKLALTSWPAGAMGLFLFCK